MLVQIECPSGRCSAVPSIMDSPTLARVERAMLRHDEDSRRIVTSQNRSALTQSLLPNNFGTETGYHAIKRGLLWQRRDRLFSRWKERYFVLTRDYLHCFRRASGPDRISEMGQFLFKIKLVDVEKVAWINKKTYSTVALELGHDEKVLLRISGDGLEDWFELLEECMLTSKERRRALKSHCDGVKRENNNSINSTLEDWLVARQKVPSIRPQRTDTVSTVRGGCDDNLVQLRERKWDRRIDDLDSWMLNENRLSLLTDIDISSCNSTLEAPSMSSSTYHRHSDDVFCVSRNGRILDMEASSLRGSFRNQTKPNAKAAENGGPSRNGYHLDNAQQQFIKFRERSHSDIQRIDRRPWRLKPELEHRGMNNQ